MLFQKTEKNATKIKFTFTQKLWVNFNKKRFLALRSSLTGSITFCYVIYYEGIFFAIGLEHSFLFLSHLTFFDFQTTSPMMPFSSSLSEINEDFFLSFLSILSLFYLHYLVFYLLSFYLFNLKFSILICQF